jgi:hypothetical protein
MKANSLGRRLILTANGWHCHPHFDLRIDGQFPPARFTVVVQGLEY